MSVVAVCLWGGGGMCVCDDLELSRYYLNSFFSRALICNVEQQL